jgi:hypothetical protein
MEGLLQGWIQIDCDPDFIPASPVVANQLGQPLAP